MICLDPAVRPLQGGSRITFAVMDEERGINKMKSLHLQAQTVDFALSMI